jgi:hypothetical protein
MKAGFVNANIDSLPTNGSGIPLTITAELKSANRKLKRMEQEHESEKSARQTLLAALVRDRDEIYQLRSEMHELHAKTMTYNQSLAIQLYEAVEKM